MNTTVPDGTSALGPAGCSGWCQWLYAQTPATTAPASSSRTTTAIFPAGGSARKIFSAPATTWSRSEFLDIGDAPC